MLTDRSRIIAMQVCPRSRYLGYEINGTGLQRVRKSLPLQFGSAFHAGVEKLLGGYPVPCDADEYIGRAVHAAHQFLQEQFDSHQISLDDRELPADAQAALDYGREEQMALAEALLRAWWSYEGEAFLESFEVLEVEREGRAILKHGRKYNLIDSQPANEAQKAEGIESIDYYQSIGEGDELVLMFRPDALVRDRMSGDLYVISWKTRAKHDKRSYDQDRHDMQSISEVWGSLQRWDAPIGKIEGVIYKYITKGKRLKDDYDGLWKNDTHLIYGWKRLKPAEGEEDWSWSYKWKDDEINPKTGKPVGHTLGKGWQKVPIWHDYPGGVKAWIDDLSHQRVFPRHVDALSQVFPQALPVERRADEVEHWKMQVIAQESEVGKAVEELEKSPIKDHLLDVLFPQYTHSCHSYSGCPFIPVCWEGAKAEVGDLYQIRLQNHPESGGDDE